MNLKRVALLFLLIVVAGLLAGCSPAAATSNWPGMAVRDEFVYLADGNHIYTLRLADGTQATIPAVNAGDEPVPLRFPNQPDTSKMTFFAQPAFTSDGQMVFPNSSPNEHSFYSIDPSNGDVNWTFNASKGTWIAGAITIGDVILAPDGEGVLYGLSNSGEELWQLKASDHGLWSHAVTDGEAAYLTTVDHFVYAINPQTGNVLWKTELDNVLMSSPAVDVANGTLYIGSLSGKLIALNAANGKVVWTTQLKGGIWSAPAVDGETLYLGTVDGQIGTFYALNAQDGSVLWKNEEAASIIGGALVLEDQVVYVTEAGLVQSRNKEGSSVWQANIEGKLYSAPVLANDLVLVAPTQGKFLLAAYNLSGAQQWVFTP